MGLKKMVGTQEGSNFINLLYCLRDYIRQHSALGKSFELLRGLTDLTIQRAEKGSDLKISSTALQVQVEGGSDVEKSPGSKLATPWKTLIERTLVDREQGIQKFFVQQGYSQYLWPMKDRSPGGAGNASMYFFEIRDIVNAQDHTQVGITKDSGMISYIPEITPKPAWWLAKLLEEGYKLRGWRSWVLIGFSLLTFLVVAASVVMAWISLAYSKNITAQAGITILVAVLMVVWLGYSTLSPLFKLLDLRIIKAPDLLVSLKEQNVLIEIVKERGASVPTKIIRLVRYAGTCPICTGKVEVVDGEKEFLNRFVGRCEEYPIEHVYSFDRFTLQGKSLR